MSIRCCLAIAALFVAVSAQAATPDATHYLGTIGGNLNISMALGSGADGVSGTYIYSQYGKDIGLWGSRSGNTVMLSEGPTGSFRLTGGSNGTLTGTWTNEEGKRSLPVSLKPVAENVVLSGSMTDVYKVDISYLRFIGETPFHGALNSELKRLATDRYKSAIKEYAGNAGALRELQPEISWRTESPSVLYADESMVSLRTATVSFGPESGVHPAIAFRLENYAWRSGRLVQLKTADLLTVTPASMKTLADLCASELKALNSGPPEKLNFGPFDAKQPPTVNFTTNGILLTFGPYEVDFGVGGAGRESHVVSLPYARLKALIPQSSPLKPLAK